jgi:hypothetical protein
MVAMLYPFIDSSKRDNHFQPAAVRSDGVSPAIEIKPAANQPVKSPTA